MSDLKDIAIAAASGRRVLVGIREGIAWYRERGVLRDELIDLLDRIDAMQEAENEAAAEEGREPVKVDLSDIEYAELAGGAQDAIGRLLAASEAAEAADQVPDPVPPAGDQGEGGENNAAGDGDESGGSGAATPA